jgi:hypothetical protein
MKTSKFDRGFISYDEKQIVCINSDYHENSLTYGKVYTFYTSYTHNYVINDVGHVATYNWNNRFISLDEFRSKRIDEILKYD